MDKAIPSAPFHRECQNCHAQVPSYERYTKGRCNKCYDYARTHGRERDEATLYKRESKSAKFDLGPELRALLPEPEFSRSDVGIRERLGLPPLNSPKTLRP